MSFLKLPNGKIRFTCPTRKGKRAFLVGDFNCWDEHSHRMKQDNKDQLQLDLDIPPGKYNFKYLVDGVWWNDPDADDYAQNSWGSEDSVIKVD